MHQPEGCPMAGTHQQAPRPLIWVESFSKNLEEDSYKPATSFQAKTCDVVWKCYFNNTQEIRDSRSGQ